jgi:RluA family pseudouridine synthase
VIAILAEHSVGLVAVEKPSGMLVIPGRTPHAQPCLKEQLEAQLKAKLWVVHRLDKDTSGVLLLALNAAAHRLASMAFENHQVDKEYLALSQGCLGAPVDVNLALAVGRKGRVRVAAEGLGKSAMTRFEPLQVLSDATLVRAIPKTGRQHQIRVHLAAVGHPLLVDPLYAREQRLEMISRTPLHAASLGVQVLNWKVEASMPSDMMEALRRLA